MHDTTGKNDTWERQHGKIAMHPAYRNGTEVPSKCRVHGELPTDCGWVPGDQGFMVAMSGKAPGEGMLYVYPLHRLDEWLASVPGRSHEDVMTFKYEETGRFGRHLQRTHPVAVAIFRAVKRQKFGASRTEYRVNVNGDSMTVRVPMRKDIKPHKQKVQDTRQGRLL